MISKSTNNKKKHGFTVLEAVVGISIITMGLLGVSSLVVQNIQVQQVNRNYLIASMLAQEGIELVRNVRDENWITMGNEWDTDITDGDGTFIIDYYGRLSIDDSVDVISDPGALLFIDGNNYYAHSGGTQTPFSRLISVVDNIDYIIVTAMVSWQGRGRTYDYVAETLLYNWR